MTPPAPAPGYHAKWFANVVGWTLDRFTLVVEGNHDEQYLQLGDQLYFDRHAKRLISPGMTIFAAGDGPDGGTKRILRDFHAVHRAAQADVDSSGRQAFRLVALLDDDPEGRGAFRSLCREDVNCVAWRDVFLLKRALPRTTRNSGELETLVDRQNELWKKLNCEIEDFLTLNFLEQFDIDEPFASSTPRVVVGGGHHSELTREGKRRLARFAKDNAMLADILGVVELLKVIRFHFGLDPDGQ